MIVCTLDTILSPDSITIIYIIHSSVTVTRIKLNFRSIVQRETFVGACDKDKDGVKNELQEMKQRWEALNNAILAKIQELEDAAAKLNAFNEGKT